MSDDALVRELQGKSDAAYCDYIARMRRQECLGHEAKMKCGAFGEAELLAHTKAVEQLGRHRAYADAIEMVRARILADGERIRRIPREPTQAMLLAATDYLPGKFGKMQWASIWRAMYDAALADADKGKT